MRPSTMTSPRLIAASASIVDGYLSKSSWRSSRNVRGPFGPLVASFGRLDCWPSDRPEAHERDRVLPYYLGPTAK